MRDKRDGTGRWLSGCHRLRRAPAVVVDVNVGPDFSPEAHLATLRARAELRKAALAVAAPAEDAAAPAAATVVALAAPASGERTGNLG